MQADNTQPVDNSEKTVDKSEVIHNDQTEILKNNSAESQIPQYQCEKCGSDGHATEYCGQNGGARTGAGRKKGGMNESSVVKMESKKKFEERVARNADVLYNAQFTVATGVQYLFYRHKEERKQKDGKTKMVWSRFERVTSPEQISQYLNGEFDKEEEYYMLTAEKPDTHAIDSLLDRAFGKAPQNLNIKDDRPDPIAVVLSSFGLLGGDDSNDGQTKSLEETTPQGDTQD